MMEGETRHAEKIHHMQAGFLSELDELQSENQLLRGEIKHMTA
jgi:hypothetical protein